MKGRFFLSLAFVMAVVFVGCATTPFRGVALAKEFRNNPDVAHYNDVGSGKGTPDVRMPDFRGTIIQVCFLGNVANKTKAWLKQLGVRDFIEDPNKDVKGIPVIQFAVGSPRSEPSGKGGYKGNLYTTPVSVMLVRQNGEKMVIGLVEESVFADAAVIDKEGTARWDWNSVYGVTAPGNADPKLIAGLSAQRGVDALLGGKGWSPGAYEAVEREFDQYFHMGK